MIKQKILIKLSGAALKDKANDSIFDCEKISALAKQIAFLNKTYETGIVVGGGNIWRGAMDSKNVLTHEGTNYIGMIATIMNGIAIHDVLLSQKIESVIFSAVNVEKVTTITSVWEIKRALSENKVAIFVGGTGYPYFTTDTTAALRALDMKAKTILMAKDGVCGIYSADPKKDKNAKFYSDLTFKEILDKKLKIMDLTTLTLCDENNLNIIVFNIDEKDGIIKALTKKSKCTLVHK